MSGTYILGNDSLHRLISGSFSSGINAGDSFQETYDHFGNRNQQTVSSPSGEQSTTYLNFTQGNNRVDGWSYDAAGNLLDDGVNQYLYDGEERLCAVYEYSASGAIIGYYYGANGTRLAKGPLTAFSCDLTQNNLTPGNAYAYGPNGEELEEVTGYQLNFSHFNIFLEGELLETFTGTTYSPANWEYALNDWVGTKRVIANYDGSISTSFFSGPFGDYLNNLGPGSGPSEQHFTGKDRDQESGLDFFGARYYNSSMGRFMSPDWSENPDTVPYADFTNPQSLNLYGYVENSPLSYRDPTGHVNEGCTTSGTPDEDGTINVTVSCPQLPPDTLDLTQMPNYTPVPMLESGLIYGPLPVVLPEITGPEMPQIGPAINNPKQDYCLRQALKGAAKDISGLSFIDDLATALTSGNISQFATPSYTAQGAQQAAGAVAGSAAATAAIRAALREDAVKVSTKAVGKAATTIGKGAGYLGLGLTANSAYEAYKQCMAQ